MSGLTEEAIAYRKLVIGGSDATIIMSGDKDAIVRLWREKRGEQEREDLSHVLPVQMGVFTEPFNIRWFEQTTGRAVHQQGATFDGFDHHFMACTVDGITDAGVTVFEAKHVNAFSKTEEVYRKYYAQCQHNMIVTGLQHAVLSVLIGTLKHEVIEVPFDPEYAQILIDAERHFWSCVLSGEPPAVIDAPAPVEAVKKVDMEGRNDWADAAVDWIENGAAAKKFESAAKKIKSLVEPDVVEAFGHGIRATRAKNGALTIRMA